jgi:hypothetical protein
MTTATANGTAATLETPAPFKSTITSIVGELTLLNASLARSNDPTEIASLTEQRAALQAALAVLKAHLPKTSEPDELAGETEDDEPVPGVIGVQCRPVVRGHDTSDGVNFCWTMRIRNRHGETTHGDERTCNVNVYVMPTENFERHRQRGVYSYTSVQDLGTGWCAVCDLTFDGISERKDSDEPESRAILKPFADDLLKWLESRGDMGYNEVTRSTNGRMHMRFDLLSVNSPDDENDRPVIELTLERNEW